MCVVMKILVTGANGYLGKGIVKQLLDLGNEVVAACLSKDGCLDERAHIIEGNIFDVDNPYEFYGKPDVLLHLAWRDGFVHFSNTHLNDLPLHVSFINKFCKSNIKQIAVMGSMHEIGFFEGSINEFTPCNPESFYGISKNALRETTSILCEQNKKIFLWLRGYYIVGNTLDGSSIFSKIAKAEAKGDKEFPFTQGLNQFDFLDYDDFCYQVACAVSQQKIDGIINICSGRPEKLADRVERFIKENNFSIKLKYGSFPDRPYDSKAVWGDNSKILKILKEKDIES